MCADADDVAATVRFAAAAALPVRMRSGGHSYGGWSTGPGLVCDVTALRSVQVDARAGTARIGAGAALVDVYGGLAAQGVAIAAGSCPTVGFTGLTLGGGVGVLTRAYGLTCDAVRLVGIVTADGMAREVDASTDPDLFWALRGGGAGFGAVTAMTVAVAPAPTVTTFLLQWPLTQAAQVLRAWQEWIAGADPRLWSTCKLLSGPAAGAARATVSGTWIGDHAQLDAQLAPLLSAVGSAPAARQVNTLSYGDAMLLEAGCYGQDAASCIADALGPQKRQPFAATSSILAAALPSAGIAAAVAGVSEAAGLAGLIEGGASFDSLGGAVAAVGTADTPFPYRSALATVQYTATWASGAVDPAPYDAFVRAQRAGLSPWLGSAAYANYADPAIVDYGTAHWADNYRRLQQVKRSVDPQGVFSFEQSVRA